MSKSAATNLQKRVKIYTSTGENLAGLHSQIDFNMMESLDNYLLEANTAILEKRDVEIQKVLRERINKGLTIKETNIKINDLKQENPQLTKRSIIETALADYFTTYPA